jgi:hypothetical protein
MTLVRWAEGADRRRTRGVIEACIRTFCLFLIAGALVMGACGGSSDGDRSGSPAAAQPATVLAPGAAKELGSVVPAAVLAADYALDEAEANTRYKAKELRVPGLISEAGKSGAGLPYVALATGWEGAPVQCIFDDGSLDISYFGIMQQVVLTGIVEGLQDTAKPVAEGDVGALFRQTSTRRVTLSGCSVEE